MASLFFDSIFMEENQMKLSTRKTLPTVIMVAITLIVLCIAAFATQGAELGTERFYNTPWALLPPVIAITLALVTKEVYSSLFVGILAGGLLYSNFSFEGTILHVFNDGIVSVLSDSYNVGILVFLGIFFPKVGLAGDTLAIIMTLGTLSFLVTTPEVWVPDLGSGEFGFPLLSGAGRLVIKDIVILASAVVLLSDSSQRVLKTLKKD